MIDSQGVIKNIYQSSCEPFTEFLPKIAPYIKPQDNLKPGNWYWYNSFRTYPAFISFARVCARACVHACHSVSFYPWVDSCNYQSNQDTDRSNKRYKLASSPQDLPHATPLYSHPLWPLAVAHLFSFPIMEFFQEFSKSAIIYHVTFETGFFSLNITPFRSIQVAAQAIIFPLDCYVVIHGTGGYHLFTIHLSKDI